MDFSLKIGGCVELPETPTWDARIQKLYWTDLGSGDVHCYDPVTESEKVWHTGQQIGSAIPCDDPDKLLCVLQHGIYLLDLSSGKLALLADPAKGNPAVRYSDSRVDAAGRIYASTVALTYGSDEYTPDQTGSFYCVERDGTIKVIDPVINQYNTVLWNKNSTTMYVADTYNETLLAYDYNLAFGVCSAFRTVLSFKGNFGMPDGMTMDEDDNLYICHWSGKISVWDKNLKPKDALSFPTPQITCGGFGGVDMKDFYVGSGSWHYDEEEKSKFPGCGGIFMARSDVAGMPYHMYKTK